MNSDKQQISSKPTLDRPIKKYEKEGKINGR